VLPRATASVIILLVEEPFPDFATLSDDDLSELIANWEAEANKLSYRRRLLHGRIDSLRAERTARRKAKGEQELPGEGGGSGVREPRQPKPSAGGPSESTRLSDEG
jgi:RsiG-like